MAGERRKVAGVLGGDDRHATEQVAGAGAQVIGVADRHGDEVEGAAHRPSVAAERPTTDLGGPASGAPAA
jgi:hypothetical protein